MVWSDMQLCTVNTVLNGMRVERNPVFSGKHQQSQRSLTSIYIKRNLSATEKIRSLAVPL